VGAVATGTGAVTGAGLGTGAAALARRVGSKARANPVVVAGVALVAVALIDLVDKWENIRLTLGV
jgi:hypothetical protein